MSRERIERMDWALIQMSLVTLDEASELMSALGRLGVGLNERNPDGYTVADLALYHGKTEFAKTLVQNGYTFTGENSVIFGMIDHPSKLDPHDPIVQKVAKRFQLIEAIKTDNEEKVDQLIAEGVEVKGSVINTTPIGLALKNSQMNIVMKLIKAGANPNERNHLGVTPLVSIVSTGNLELIDELVKAGANINMGNEGIKPVDAAVLTNQPQVLDYLIKKGAVVESELLRKAITFRKEEAVQILINSNTVDVNEPDNLGRPPLKIATTGKIAQMLIDAGANVHVKDSLNRTPLYNAVRDKKMDVVRVLIENGAYTTKKDQFLIGASPMDVANDAQKIQIKQMKQDYRLRRAIRNGGSLDVDGADPNGVDSKGRSMLSYAIERGDLEIVKKLVAKGADINKLSSDGLGYSPLHEAALTDKKPIYDFLKKKGAVEIADKRGRMPSRYLNPEDRWETLSLSAPSLAQGVVESKGAGVGESLRASLQAVDSKAQAQEPSIAAGRATQAPARGGASGAAAPGR